MNGWKDFGGIPDFLRDPRQIARLNSVLVYVLLFGGSFFTSYIIVSKIGMQLFMMAVIGIFFGTIYNTKSVKLPYVIII